jgi:hypothetical protein
VADGINLRLGRRHVHRRFLDALDDELATAYELKEAFRVVMAFGRPWLNRVEVAPPPLPGHDLGAGVDLGL